MCVTPTVQAGSTQQPHHHRQFRAGDQQRLAADLDLQREQFARQEGRQQQMDAEEQQ